VLERIELPLLDTAISKLDITLTELDTLESQTDTISSKLSEVIIDNRNNTSSLSLIANTSIAIASSLDNFNLPISKLSFVNSQLDDVVQDAFTIESVIDKIFVGLVTINSSLDRLISKTVVINSDLDSIANTDVAISSKLALTINNLTTVNSNLDQINNISQSSLSTLVTVESRLGRTSSIFDTLAIASIESKLVVTSNLETSVISKLDLANNLIATANNDAQGLIADFQSTWTILNKINNTSLPPIQTTLNIIESTLEHLNPYSISTVFTVIDVIVRNEATINSQVDVYNSMVDAFTRRLSTDFNGVFTALGAINSSLVSSTSQLATISSKLAVVQTELGFPIYSRNIPLTITTPGRYYLAENITYLGGSTAIVINTSNVSLDFNQRSIIGTPSVRAIDTATGLSNIAIFNGKTVNAAAIAIGTGATNIRVRDIVTIGGGNGYFGSGRNISVRNYSIINGGSSNAMLFQSHTNVDVTDCFFRNNQGVVMQFNTSNIVINNCEFHNTLNCVLPNGSHTNVLVKNCRAMNTLFGVTCTVTSLVGLDIVNNYFETMANPAFNMQGSNGTIVGNTAINNTYGVFGQSGFANSFIGFNDFIQNTSTNVNLTSGAHTVLGNFAFNTNAAGPPNNTNYNVSGSTTSITGKFITGSQRGSFGDFPDKWHNINMLP